MAQADELQDADKLMDEQNYAGAAELYQHLADANDIRALNRLAVMYWRGGTVDRDVDKALEYAIRIDQQSSNAHTQGFISMLYMSKSPSDDVASYIWLKKATQTENVPGLFYRLAKYYEGGVGIPVNYERAYIWYRMSTLSPEANMDKYNRQKIMVQIKLSEIESTLSDDKVRSASKLAERCFNHRLEECY